MLILFGGLGANEMFRNLSYCHIDFFDKYLKGMEIGFDGIASDKVTYRNIMGNRKKSPKYIIPLCSHFKL